MPELPEVETVCRTLRPALVGETVKSVKAVEDSIIFKSVPREIVEAKLKGQKIQSIDRKGKYFWLCLDEECLFAHFGMSGWAHLLSPDDPEPKFTKLLIDTGKHRVAFTDPRRLGRLWFSKDPSQDKQVKALGFDSLNELPPGKKLFEMVHRRNAPIKAVLLDQSVFAGVGNYLADEALYQARIAPMRSASDLSEAEVGRLRTVLHKILVKAVEVGADENQFPDDWMFHKRWGGKRGAETIGRHKIRREVVAGRSTAWVPTIQK